MATTPDTWNLGVFLWNDGWLIAHVERGNLKQALIKAGYPVSLKTI